MELLKRLEAAAEALLEQNRILREENSRLQREKESWAAERSQLLTEIDRILQRMEDI
ncbi:cell division protein ZapB [Pelobacter seleniigenes]|uniref:cell division protein ZapB n=1 Tax=Pelobacter seleniigenes TaxID=407188 RepID=UPI0012B6CF72|nr:cell division protein ZapB [Pelobacter seleniigenes]